MSRQRRVTPAQRTTRQRRVRPEPAGQGRSRRRRADGADEPDRGAAPASDARTDSSPATPARDDAADARPDWWAHPMLRAGMYAWALVGLLLTAVAATMAMGALRLVVVPVLLALFPAALLYPLVGWLRRLGLPSALAALATILGVLAVLAGVGTALAPQVAEEAPAMVESISDGIGEIEALLDESAPFGIDAAELRAQIDSTLADVDTDAMFDLARAGALGAAAAVAETATMTLLLLVVLFFYLKDGERLGRWACRLFPAAVQADAEAVGLRAWTTIGAYFRGQLFVAVVDAIGIGVGLWVLGVPLALPLAVLVFFGGLFPIVGAVATGAVAVLVALATSGPWVALGVLGVVVGVQQLESNVMAPVVLGKATQLHPLGVLMAITAGGILLGVLGAFLAVPVAASVTRGISALRERRPREPVRPASAPTG